MSKPINCKPEPSPNANVGNSSQPKKWIIDTSIKLSNYKWTTTANFKIVMICSTKRWKIMSATARNILKIQMRIIRMR